MKSKGYKLISIPWRNQAIYFMIQEYKHNGDLFKIARFITIESADYLDFQGIEEIDREFFYKLWNELNNHDVEALLLSNIIRNSSFHQLLHNCFSHAIDIDCIPTLGVICHGTGLDSYYTSIGKASARNLKRIRKRCAQSGMVFQYDRLTNSSIEWMLNHQKQRASSAGYTVIENTIVEEVITKQAKSDRFNIARIIYNGEDVSCMIVLEDTKTLAVYIQAFDSRFSNYYPSLFLLSELVEYANRYSFEYIDLLRGKEIYKTRFCNHSISLIKTLVEVKKVNNWNGIVQMAKSMIE